MRIGFFKTVTNKRAQIVLPAVLLIPTILLVIYLLFETTKISREKIRHQFALDTSAFVELTSTSHYLNATAYVNGTFPYRVLKETFEYDKKQIPPDERNGGQEAISFFDLYYEGGAFPAMQDGSSPASNDEIWELKHYQGSRPEFAKDVPTIDEKKVYPVTSEDLALKNLAYWNVDYAKLYLMIYYLLGQIYDDQTKVYERLTNEGEFFRKGYYLNTGNCKMSECGKEGARAFKDYLMRTEPLYISKIAVFYKSENTNEVKPLNLDLKDADIFDGKLFQLAYISKGSRDKLRTLYKGIEITQPFTAPTNYFNVRFKQPYTHARVALQCTKESNNCVWPDPTPKYQVRLFP